MLDGLEYYRIFGFPVMMYIGILSFLFLLSTAIAALRMKHGRFSMIWHHRMVVITLIVAGVHGMMGLLGEGVIGTDIEGAGTYQKPEKSEDITYGRKIFRENCIQCHPGGGNMINPSKPLKGSARLKDFNAFVLFIRHAGGMMPSFASQQISDKEAIALYRYIISVQNLD